MSGHSKWSTIKRKKGVADARRGQMFTKLAREIQIAARDSGGDPAMNFRLRLAIDRARQSNMPNDNIERAVLRGTGELKGEAIEEINYEGYGPRGTAVIVDVLTDNRNRTVSDVRRVFARHGGNLGETGCVAWLFERKGYISIVPQDGVAEEVALMAIDAGAEDVKLDEDLVEVFTRLEDLQKVKQALTEAEVPIDSAELSWIPKSMVLLDEKATLQNMRLIDELEELDDVRQVYSNLEISDEAMAEYETA
ncbi:MAG: YebC/PmpR family DNA-binding transcriptional regulator [Anaerolineales bacterium]|nr:MAG: YebC/PmpR family DNA-binding transcriptional regulator [Anaerolineales bacterium]